MSVSQFEKEKYMKRISYRLAWALLLVAISSSCGLKVSYNAISTKIEDQQKLLGVVGGTEANANDEISKHVVSIIIEEPRADGGMLKHSGTGVIISNHFIITAAHIFRNLKIKTGPQSSGMTAYMNFGLSPRTSIRQDFYARDFLNRTANEVSDPAYLDDPTHSDYVLIRLSNGVPAGFSKMGVINELNFIKAGDQVKLAGFGKTNGEVFDYTLRILDVTITATDVSKATRLPIGVTSQSDQAYFLEIASLGSHRLAPGDSGGPIFYERVVDGRTEIALAGIQTQIAKYNTAQSNCSNIESDACLYANYGLRFEAFHDEAFRTGHALAH